ncbi:hypothetical protein [Bradyrhizobium sp.]|uniref:hypothetical protein n=1 Tax=Bradyrhizobium sp. TaxID=376 RepID=UPI002D35ABB5|nr:hypothetical protein [Bradyrhizobium sp.]HZR74543.1 hypothetical protein [Bradyrhizobium sp.]
MAFWLVVVGIGFEAVCTIFLFVFDEGISNAQQRKIEADQRKIIALENKLAARALSSDQSAMIVSRLSKAAQDAGKISYVFSATDDEEISFAIDLSDNVFSKLGWTWEDWPTNPSILEMTTRLPGRKKVGWVPLNGVQVQAFDPKLEKVVATLVAGLRDAGIENVRTDPKADSELQSTNPQMTIIVMVGMRPTLRIPAE